jgi:hypothetical protein
MRIADGVSRPRETPYPSGWTVTTAMLSIFQHQATGTRIALPVKGPWIANPARPTVLACDDAHVELHC